MDTLTGGMVENSRVEPEGGKAETGFLPIVNIHTGDVLGFEAVVEGTHGAGILRGAGTLEAVFGRFTAMPGDDRLKLFLPAEVFGTGQADICSVHEVDLPGQGSGAMACLFSERGLGLPNAPAVTALERVRRLGARIAIDDFGGGRAGLQWLYLCEPDFVRLDGFFLRDALTDVRKQILLRHLVHVAHLIGALVIAREVADARTYFLCKEAGCDLIQGALLGNRDDAGTHPPVLQGAPKLRYSNVERLALRERRTRGNDQHIILEQMEVIEPVRSDTAMLDIFETFRKSRTRTFFPVVDTAGQPLGLVREADFKEYIYSFFGRELIANKSVGRTLADFISRCPVADVNTRPEKILEIFSADQAREGIIMTDKNRYVGFLSAHSLLRVINEKNLNTARDQNPLTRLPGNTVIHEYLSRALADTDTGQVLVYFDFDNFKPFNDHFGFRQGDRAITLFADLMRKHLTRAGTFIGHIGGDDFFAAFAVEDTDGDDAITACIRDLIARFADDAASFYGEDARRQGHIHACGRDGRERRIPLLGVSAALLELTPDRVPVSADDISIRIAALKKQAKTDPSHMAHARIGVRTGNRP